MYAYHLWDFCSNLFGHIDACAWVCCFPYETCLDTPKQYAGVVTAISHRQNFLRLQTIALMRYGITCTWLYECILKKY
jgi:hypothetical protein